MGGAGRVAIPEPGGGWRSVPLHEPREWPEHPAPFRSRAVLAGAHVVADPLAENGPGAPAALDWEATLAFRRHLFRYGFGVAEAMDTAQRNQGLDWPAVRELVRRSAAQAAELGGRVAAGAGTDHRVGAASVPEVVEAYAEQIDLVQASGAQVIVMASRQLARLATGPADYRQAYRAVLARVDRPAILHWLGEAFDPQLRSYWGSAELATATEVFLELVHEHAGAIDGVKVSLLSAGHETALRARLPAGVRLYTGDDFHYPELIRGDGTRHSDALLGAFAAIAPAASAALAGLDAGDLARYDAELAPTVPLSRQIFAPPTYYYKTGIAFLAWLSGRQPGFSMVGGLQSARSVVHLSQVFALANQARLLPDPELAAHRLGLWLAAAGASR